MQLGALARRVNVEHDHDVGERERMRRMLPASDSVRE